MLKKDKFWLLIIFIFALLSFRTLIHKGYFPMHDDLQMMRQLQMEKCFLDGQIPCRWVPDMGYGFGFPLFNFYPPLPYLIGEGIRILGFAFTDTVKILFSLSLLASGLAMYFLAKEFFGRLGGLISAAFYIWAPYHALDIFVRGAMNEAWALAWFPLICWTSYRLITSDKRKVAKWLIGLSLSWLALLTSHNLMVFIFAPVFAGWSLIFLWREKKWARIPHLALSGILSLGLAAFFTIPAITENKFTWVKSQLTGYYDYTAHFVSLSQIMISRFWGYGASVFGDSDEMAFPIGHFHWISALIVGAFAAFSFLRKKVSPKLQTTFFILLFMFSVGWLASFMTHARSTPIWLKISPLRLLQFPWRFLTIPTFSFSFLAGGLVFLLPKGKKALFAAVSLLLLSVAIWNWNFFRVERTGPVTDAEKFSGEAWRIQQTAGIYDYLPIAAKEAPKESRKVLAEVMNGEGIITDMKQGTNWASFTSSIQSAVSSVRINILKFPDWKVYLDGEPIESFIPDEEKWGRMWIEVPVGSHKIEAKFVNTPIRSLSNAISLISWLGLGTYFVLKSRK